MTTLPTWACAGLAAMALGATVLAQEPGNQTGLKDHPCLLMNAAGLPALRAKAADEQPNRFGFVPAAVWQDIRRNADRLAALPTYSYAVSIPGEGGVTLEEWSYTLSAETPPPHPLSPNYPPWTAMFQERADSISTRLIHFSFAALVTGEEPYFLKAREIALALCQWQDWTDRSYGAGRIDACLDTGHLTYSVAMFYDWCFDRLENAERQLIRTALIEKGIGPILGYVDHYPPDTNGYAVLLAGATLAALAVRPEDARGGVWLQECLDKMAVSLDRGGKDGGTFEGPGYGTYLLDSLALGFDALTSAEVEHGLFEHPYLAAMPRYCVGLLAPDTLQIPCFSDGSPGIAVPRLMRILAQRGSTDAAFYLGQIGALKVSGIYDFVRFDEARLDPQTPTWNPSSVFVDIGYASLRDGFNAAAPTLFFKSGPTTNSIGHNHYDHNAFVISYGRQWLVPDRGYHNFYIPAKRKFSLGSIGHCTVVMDIDDAWMADTKVPSPGHDQVQRAGGRITDFFAGQAFDYVRGAAAAAYNPKGRTVLERFDRQIVYVKPHTFILRDDLAAPEPHAYSFLLHSDGVGDIEGAHNAWRLLRTNVQLHTLIQASVPTQARVQTYPGAETYGPFLRVETAPSHQAAFLAMLVPQPYANPSWLRNGGFEKGLSGWVPRTGPDLPNHRLETAGVHGGSQCAAIDRSGYLYSERFSLPVGSRVEVRAWIRTLGTPEDKGATMTLYFWRQGKAFAQERVGPFRHDDWQEHRLAATVPADTDELCVALEYFAAGTAFFDDVVVESDAPVVAGLEPQMAMDGADSATLRLGDETVAVLCSTRGQRRQAGDLAADAEMAVLVLDAGGQPTRAFLHQGSFVTWKGHDLLRLERPGSAEIVLADGALSAQLRTDTAPHAALPAAPVLSTALRGDRASLNGQPAVLREQAGGLRISLGGAPAR